jgi:DNA topoisomerase I
MLIIVESPAKAKTIAQILSGIKELKNTVVRASKGHIRVISDTKKSKAGSSLEINGIDIDNGFTPIYETDKAKADVITELKKLAKTQDKILFATDEDREGEAISWHLAEVLGIKDMSKIERMVFHEITSKAILAAIANPRALNTNLVSAQKARQVLDKLVGYKLSPVLWKVLGNYGLSAGRVQSPALRLICEREDQINKFVAKEYWEVRGLFNPASSKSLETKAAGINIVSSSNTITSSQNGQKTNNPSVQNLLKIFSIKELDSHLSL